MKKKALLVSYLLVFSMFGVLPVFTTVKADSTVDIYIESATLNVGDTIELRIWVLNFPTGFSGYRMNITLSDSNIAEIKNVTFPSWATLTQIIDQDLGWIYVKAVDLSDQITSTTINITLITVEIQATNPGTVQLDVTIEQIDDDFGNPINAIVHPGTITVNSESEIVDVYEPNDDISSAYQLPGPGEYPDAYLSQADRDWFKFTIYVPSTATIETYHTGYPEPDTYMVLYDSNSNILASDDNSGDSSFSKITKTLTPGTYYVKVKGWSIYEEGPYGLRLTFIPLASDISKFLELKDKKDVYLVVGSDALHASGVIPGYMAAMYFANIIGVKKSQYDSTVNLTELSSNSTLILMGGPAVNTLTAYYETIAPVKMILSPTSIIIQTPLQNYTWYYPWVEGKKWYNVTYGYFVIQVVQDSDTGATVYMVYGTDADSTWAGAYYLAKIFNEGVQDQYQGITYIVGKWTDIDNEIDQIFLKFTEQDNNGFSETDEITILEKG